MSETGLLSNFVQGLIKQVGCISLIFSSSRFLSQAFAFFCSQAGWIPSCNKVMIALVTGFILLSWKIQDTEVHWGRVIMKLSSYFENLGSAVAGLQICMFQESHIVYVVQETLTVLSG